MTLAKKVVDTFFKRSVVYVPVVLVGAYFANEFIDTGLMSVWESHNKGKLFKHMTFPAPSDEE